MHHWIIYTWYGKKVNFVVFCKFLFVVEILTKHGTAGDLILKGQLCQLSL